MSTENDIPKFPDITPDSIKKTRIWEYENTDFATEEDISELLAHLFDYPEDEFFLYTPKEMPINELVQKAVDANALIILETQAFFYPHPKLKRDYVRIREHSVLWDWEREVLADGRMYFRHQLKLSERARRTFEMQQLVAMQKASNANPIKLEPNFMGIGIDLRKAYAWLIQQFKKK